MSPTCRLAACSRFALWILPVSVVASMTTACSSGSALDAAPGTFMPDAGPRRTATQEGTLVEFGSGTPVADAVVRVGDRATTSDALGHYALPVDTRAPYATQVSANGYVPVNDQWAVYQVDAVHRPTFLFSTSRAKAMLEGLDAYDPALGVLIIEVVGIGNCHSVAGAGLRVSQSSAKVAYLREVLPLEGVESAGLGDAVAAVVYNLTPGVAVDVAAESPSCETADRPVTLDEVTYYEVVPIEVGALAFERVFLGRLTPESIPSQ